MARKTGAVHAMVASAVALAAFALFLDSGGGLVKTIGRDPTLTGRREVWSAVLLQVHSPLLGTGYEGFWLGDRLEKVWDAVNMKGIQEAHNGYIEIYLNLGWLGLSCLAVLIVTGYRNVLATLHRDPAIGRLWLAYFVVGLVYNFTEAGFRMMALVWIFFLCSIMAVPEGLPALRGDDIDTLSQEEPELGYAHASALRKKPLEANDELDIFPTASVETNMPRLRFDCRQCS